MQCLPDNLRDRVYYHPTNEGIEKRIRERLEQIRRMHPQGSADPKSRQKNEP
jgi:putative ATPase